MQGSSAGMPRVLLHAYHQDLWSWLKWYRWLEKRAVISLVGQGTCALRELGHISEACVVLHRSTDSEGVVSEADATATHSRADTEADDRDGGADAKLYLVIEELYTW